ncbi:sarcoplasmic reticulum histidine-rich calcium-binding protein-like [Leptopilina boulardi]|uniref:sarcoplasmic reticulum histidine-rich calcium-binding protein-like n=1 Tax=Leptopilina boulardi TaxID=63433 RepID=UPI0021F52B0E|nr:sarcoplasmic reticulum histidine-rich calcium-binding protein-like [Leptopilina boulardi]
MENEHNRPSIEIRIKIYDEQYDSEGNSIVSSSDSEATTVIFTNEDQGNNIPVYDDDDILENNISDEEISEMDALLQSPDLPATEETFNNEYHHGYMENQDVEVDDDVLIIDETFNNEYHHGYMENQDVEVDDDVLIIDETFNNEYHHGYMENQDVEVDDDVLIIDISDEEVSEILENPLDNEIDMSPEPPQTPSPILSESSDIFTDFNDKRKMEKSLSHSYYDDDDDSNDGAERTFILIFESDEDDYDSEGSTISESSDDSEVDSEIDSEDDDDDDVSLIVSRIIVITGVDLLQLPSESSVTTDSKK